MQRVLAALIQLLNLMLDFDAQGFHPFQMRSDERRKIYEIIQLCADMEKR